MRFVSHLELAHLFYRASKRAGLSLCYSEGFHPMPRIVFARALPVGVESLEGDRPYRIGEKNSLLRKSRKRLNAVLPQGIEIIEAEEVPLFSSPVVLSPLHSLLGFLDHLLQKEEVCDPDQRGLRMRRNSILIRRGRGRREGWISDL